MKLRLRRLWLGTASVALATMMVLTLHLVLAATNDNLTRITLGSSVTRSSTNPGINADGTKITFESLADLLNQGHETRSEIWLYDTATMTFTRVTSSETPGAAFYPSISADGTKIVFSSDYDFDKGQAQDSRFDLWQYDTNTMSITRITNIGNFFGGSFESSSDADGTNIAFRSNANFFTGGATVASEIWLYDTGSMTFTRITSASENTRFSTEPAINANGTKVAFRSTADLLSQGIPADQEEIWLYDTARLTVTRITSASHSNRDSHQPSITADGTKIVFASNSDFLAQGIPFDQQEIWLFDTTTMTLTRITTASQVGRDSMDPSISADGTRIAFLSDSDFLGQGIPSLKHELWLVDSEMMTVTRLTTLPPGGGRNLSPSLSGDGSALAFQSIADFFDEGLTGAWEIWLRQTSQAIVSHQIHLPIILKNS